MSITPSSLGSIAGVGTSSVAPPVAATESFANTLSSALDQVHNLQATAEQKVSHLLAGSGQDLHTATLAVERATLAFDLMLQVRNKVVSAYQEISRLQF